MSPRHAFTLIELLVVISIIAVLAAMLLPAVGMVREASRASVCASNQRQILLAVYAYCDEKEGLLPDSQQVVLGQNSHWSINTYLGPYLEIEASVVPWNAALGTGDIRMMKGAWRITQCPSERQRYPTSGHYGLNSKFCGDYQRPSVSQQLSAANPASTTVLLADVPKDPRFSSNLYTPAMVFGNGDSSLPAGWVGLPQNQQQHLGILRHRRTCNLGFADGHVRSSPNFSIEEQAETIRLR